VFDLIFLDGAWVWHDVLAEGVDRNHPIRLHQVLRLA
jgi:hypothetical protein